MSRIKEFLQISEAEVKAAREFYNKTEEDINGDVNLLLIWLQKQPHLPQPHDKVRLERILLRNKFRVEQTKSKLDHYYTFKTLCPEFFDLNPQSVRLQNVRKSMYVLQQNNWEDRWVKMSRIKEYLQVSDAEVKAVRQLYNKTEEDINGDVNLLLIWLQKQPHLPQPHDKVRLERILLRNKFRVEQTKSKLDHYYTFKTLYPEFYNLNPESVWLRNIRKSLTIAPMPKLLPGLERLYCCQFVKDEDDNYNVMDKFQYFIMFWELQLSHDYNLAEVHIWDFKYFSFKHVVKFDINQLQKGFSILQQAFSGRFSRIYYVNVPPTFDIVMNILGRVMDSKLFRKIQIHKEWDPACGAIPKEYLPEEFGGNAGSLTKLSDEWYEELKLQKDFFEANSKNCSDESLRIGKSIKNDLFGVDGTFKKINLD